MNLTPIEQRWRSFRATMDIGKTQDDALTSSFRNRFKQERNSTYHGKHVNKGRHHQARKSP